MKDKLPELFRGNIREDVSNNKNIYTSFYNKNNKDISENINNYSRLEIDAKIAELFNSNDYIYKLDVNIVTDNGILKKRIVGKVNDNLLTFDNEYIPISDIRDIYRT